MTEKFCKRNIAMTPATTKSRHRARRSSPAKSRVAADGFSRLAPFTAEKSHEGGSGWRGVSVKDRFGHYVANIVMRLDDRELEFAQFMARAMNDAASGQRKKKASAQEPARTAGCRR